MPAVLEKVLVFGSDESGATAIEYGLIAAMIAVAIISSMTLFGGSLASMFNMVSSRSQEAMGG